MDQEHINCKGCIVDHHYVGKKGTIMGKYLEITYYFMLYYLDCFDKIHEVNIQ